MQEKRGVYDDGTDFIPKPQLCPECHKEIKVDVKKENNSLIWITTCPFCGYKKIDKDDSDKWEAKRKKEEERDKKILKDCRAEFCWSDEVGQNAILHWEQFEIFMKNWREQEEHKEEYEAVANIKKLTVVDLEKLLNDTINPQGYIRFELSKPEFGRQLTVSFTAQDGNASRQEYDSRNGLRKLIQGALAGTNWRLMSEGVTYRLGYLQGHLKAYETEEDLLNLISSGKKA